MKAIHNYVVVICVLGLASAATHDWLAFVGLPTSSLIGFTTLLVLGLMSEGLALSYTVGKVAGTSSITWIPALACVLLFGPAATVLFLIVTGGFGEFLVRKKPPLRAAFNVAQYALSATLAGLAFIKFGGVPLAVYASRGADLGFIPQFGPFIVFGVVLLGTNHLLVSVAIALSQDLPVRHVWKAMVGKSGTNVLYDLLVSPIAIVVAFLYFELGITGLIILLLPLFFIHHAYLINHKLQQSNKDLLAVLVKAIETRDPYTSGHSLRVSSLAKDIADRVGISSRKVEAIETAALLHDIGKIDVVFSDILRKPGSLTPEERAIIESHTVKGEELLRSLSSFKADITGAVRHHHERIDGLGYPDGLEGEEIPLGARIIKVCDAIDAMLSDRPYRKALAPEDVRCQLELYAGVQFDDDVVHVILESDLLRSFAERMESDEVKEEDLSVTTKPARFQTRVS